MCTPLSTQNRGDVKALPFLWLKLWTGSNPTLNPQMMTTPEGIPVEKQEGKKLGLSMSSWSKRVWHNGTPLQTAMEVLNKIPFCLGHCILDTLL